MPPFKPPQIPNQRDQHWRNSVRLEFRDPSIVWDDLWHQFNSIQIPLLDEDAFYADAICVAREARDRQHLDELMGQKMEQRLQELTRAVEMIATSSILARGTLLTKAARNSALKVGRTGSLDSFVQFVSETISGWDCGNQLDNSACSIPDSYTCEDVPLPTDQVCGGQDFQDETELPPEAYTQDNWVDQLPFDVVPHMEAETDPKDSIPNSSQTGYQTSKTINVTPSKQTLARQSSVGKAAPAIGSMNMPFLHTDSSSNPQSRRESRETSPFAASITTDISTSPTASSAHDKFSGHSKLVREHTPVSDSPTGCHQSKRIIRAEHDEVFEVAVVEDSHVNVCRKRRHSFGGIEERTRTSKKKSRMQYQSG